MPLHTAIQWNFIAEASARLGAGVRWLRPADFRLDDFGLTAGFPYIPRAVHLRFVRIGERLGPPTYRVSLPGDHAAYAALASAHPGTFLYVFPRAEGVGQLVGLDSLHFTFTSLLANTLLLDAGALSGDIADNGILDYLTAQLRFDTETATMVDAATWFDTIQATTGSDIRELAQTTLPAEEADLLMVVQRRFKPDGN
jgi:hypothetical protein